MSIDVDGCDHAEIKDGMCELLQDGHLGHDQVPKHLEPFRHVPTNCAPRLWIHKHRKVLKEEVEVIIEEENAEVIEGLSRHVKMRKMNSNEATTEEMLSWLRIVRFIKQSLQK